MKTTKYILLLTLIFISTLHICFSLTNENELEITKSKLAGFNLGFERSSVQENYSFGVIAISKEIEIFDLVQISPINVGVVYNDLYNNGNKNYSYIIPATIATYSTLAYLTSAYILNENKNRVFIFIPVFVAGIITNSKFGWKIYNIETGKRSFFNSSLFVKTKLDYFSNNMNNWWRWNPSLGLQFTEGFSEVINPSYCFSGGNSPLGSESVVKNAYGFALEMGIQKPIDFGVANLQSHKFTPYIGLNLIASIGIFRVR